MNSPTARLLQTSRLFSLPRPLPTPALELATSNGAFRASDTATLPHPTHQAIVTPASSHFRGDWGLKRPLPGKATRYTSTPVIRVRAQDNPQHITDFESAADHVLTERKWQEMGVPLIVSGTKSNYTRSNRVPSSVYEENLDNTDPNVAANLNPTSNQRQSRASLPDSSNRRNARLAESMNVKRWKYDSPWITGMREGDFNNYIAKTIASRKGEFRKFLVTRIADRRVQDEERSLREQGIARQLSAARIQSIRRDVEQNFDQEEKKLRDSHAEMHLGSDLTAAICDFLDLPGVRSSQPSQSQSFANSISASLGSDSAGPPSTHPAAGLSHLRTNAFMENHPLWGPQSRRAPVLARVIRPRLSATGNDFQAKLGVGGIVTNDTKGGAYHPERNSALREEQPKEQRWLDAERMTYQLDADLENGNKMWVHPETAHVDEQGRIDLSVTRGDKEAIAVHTSHVEPIIEARSARHSPSIMAAPGTAGNANYGNSLADRRYASPTSSVRGFDRELGRTRQQGQMSNKDQSDRIRELLSGSGRERTP